MPVMPEPANWFEQSLCGNGMLELNVRRIPSLERPKRMQDQELAIGQSRYERPSYSFLRPSASIHNATEVLGVDRKRAGRRPVQHGSVRTAVNLIRGNAEHG